MSAQHPRTLAHRSGFLAVVLVTMGLWSLEVRAQTTPLYDVVIRGGRVLDGAGNPWVRADVAVRAGRIVRMGRVEGAGRREVDARGLYVSPGFIDMMDQSGSVLPQNGLAENKVRMGVTTAIGGEGGTPVAVDAIGAYFRDLEESGISINFGTYFSQTQTRVAVLGGSARAPDADELERMKEMMRSAMRQGVMGNDECAHLPAVVVCVH